MKKMILVLAAVTAGYTLCAQETVAYKGQTTSTNYAYSVPEPIRIRFQTTYADPALATWTPMNGWWHATYKDNENRIMHVYYNTQPWYLVPVPGREVNYKVALPMLNSYVPERVITAAINAYGANLYSITALKTANNEESYQVGLLENGKLRMVMLNPESTAFMKTKNTDTNR